MDSPPPTVSNLLWIQLVLELDARDPGLARRVLKRVDDVRARDNVISARFWEPSAEFERAAEEAFRLAQATVRVAERLEEEGELPPTRRRRPSGGER